MNPVEVTIKISVTAPEGVTISESTSAPAPLEQLPSVSEAGLPVPVEAAIETVSGGEELPEPLPLEQLKAAASEEAHEPGEMPEPIALTELAAITSKPSVEGPPEPEELDTLAAEEK